MNSGATGGTGKKKGGKATAICLAAPRERKAGKRDRAPLSFYAAMKERQSSGVVSSRQDRRGKGRSSPPREAVSLENILRDNSFKRKLPRTQVEREKKNTTEFDHTAGMKEESGKRKRSFRITIRSRSGNAGARRTRFCKQDWQGANLTFRVWGGGQRDG